MRATSKPGWLFLLLAMLAALSLFVAACGDDDDDSDDSGDDVTATARGDSGDDDDDETDAPDGDDDDEPTDAPDGDDDDDDSDVDLEELAQQYSDFRGKITYTASDLGEDEADLETITIYQSDNASRFDIASSSGDSSIITAADAFYICSEGQCLKYPTDSDDANPFGFITGIFSADYIADLYTDLGDDVNVDVESSTETIAGIEATCFDYDAEVDDTNEGPETGQICFSSEGGILLRISSDFGGLFEATDVTTDISDADFEPPFPVVDLGDFLGT